MKALLVKCAPVNGKAKEIVMAYNNKYLLVTNGYHH